MQTYSLPIYFIQAWWREVGLAKLPLPTNLEKIQNLC